MTHKKITVNIKGFNRMITQKKQIVLIDDETEIVELVTDILLDSDSKRYYIKSFNDPGKAVAYINDNSYSINVIITDIRMPNMSGIDLLYACIDIQRIPVLFLTGLDDDKTIDAAFKVRDKVLTVNYLVKPFNQTMLISAIETLIKTQEYLEKFKSEFYYRISDVILNPLHTISGNISLLTQGLLKKADFILEEIDSEITQLKKYSTSNEEEVVLIKHIINELQSIESYIERNTLKEYSLKHIERISKFLSEEKRKNIQCSISRIYTLLDDEKEKTHTSYNRIKGACDYMTGLVEMLMSFSKIQLNRDIPKKEVPLNDFINSVKNEVLTLIEREGKEEKIVLNYTINDDVPETIKMNDNKTKQALLILISNSVKFSDWGTILINVTREDEYIVISVVDEGKGIRNEEKNSIFNDIFKTSGETDKTSGSGLSLVLAKNLIEMQGGSIGFDSKFGQGSIFWFSIPIE